MTDRDFSNHTSAPDAPVDLAHAALARLTDEEQRLFDEAKFIVKVHSANLCQRFRHIPRAELEQEGYVAILGALRRYDRTRDARFSSFCYARVQGAMIDFATKETHASLESIASRHLAADEETEPDPFDSREAKEAAVAVMRGRMTSFILKMALAPSAQRDPEELVIARARHEALMRLLPELDDEERAFVKHFYEDEQTLEATGERMGVHKRTATRIHQRLKQRLTPKLVGHEP